MSERILCQICSQTYPLPSTIEINDCHHRFCQPCLEIFFSSYLRLNRNYPITCPYELPSSFFSCRTRINPEIIVQILENDGSILTKSKNKETPKGGIEDQKDRRSKEQHGDSRKTKKTENSGSKLSQRTQEEKKSAFFEEVPERQKKSIKETVPRVLSQTNESGWKIKEEKKDESPRIEISNKNVSANKITLENTEISKRKGMTPAESIKPNIEISNLKVIPTENIVKNPIKVVQFQGNVDTITKNESKSRNQEKNENKAFLDRPIVKTPENQKVVPKNDLKSNLNAGTNLKNDTKPSVDRSIVKTPDEQEAAPKNLNLNNETSISFDGSIENGTFRAKGNSNADSNLQDDLKPLRERVPKTVPETISNNTSISFENGTFFAKKGNISLLDQTIKEEQLASSSENEKIDKILDDNAILNEIPEVGVLCKKCNAFIKKEADQNETKCQCGYRICCECGEALKFSFLSTWFHSYFCEISQISTDFESSKLTNSSERYCPDSREFSENAPPKNKTNTNLLGPLKNDGTPDYRFSANRTDFQKEFPEKSGPVNLDGNPDRRYTMNKTFQGENQPLKTDESDQKSILDKTFTLKLDDDYDYDKKKMAPKNHEKRNLSVSRDEQHISKRSISVEQKIGKNKEQENPFQLKEDEKVKKPDFEKYPNTEKDYEKARRENIFEPLFPNTSKRCEKCNTCVQNSEGRNEVTCICGHSFCFKCGEEFGWLNFIFSHKCPVPDIFSEKPAPEINIKNDFASAFTGLKKDGTPDYRIAANRTDFKVNYPNLSGPANMDGTPDMRFNVNQNIQQPPVTGLKKDGTPDYRIYANRCDFQVNFPNVSGPVNLDGTPDMRFNLNRAAEQSPMIGLKKGPVNMDGTPEMRFNVNQGVTPSPVIGLKKDGTPDNRLSENRVNFQYGQFGPVNVDGSPDIRYIINQIPQSGPSKGDGTPDMRFKENKAHYGRSQTLDSYEHLKKDGTPDMRFAQNKLASQNLEPVGPLKSDGTPDMRFAANKMRYGNTKR